jgi:hypothetical protein
MAGGLVIDLQDEAHAAPLVKLIADGEAEIEEVRKGKPSPEEAFLSLVEGGEE